MGRKGGWGVDGGIEYKFSIRPSTKGLATNSVILGQRESTKEYHSFYDPLNEFILFLHNLFAVFHLFLIKFFSSTQ